MSKSIKLHIEPNFDFILMAIVTSEPIYRLGWLTNKKLEIQLKESPPLKAYHLKRQLVQEFSNFQYTNAEDTVFHLIQNKSQQGLLIEEHKQVDYWLKIENSELKATDLLLQLKDLENINLVFEVKPGSLKSKYRLLFSEEHP